MDSTLEIHLHAIQPFETDSNTVYTIETAAHLTHVPRHLILVYYKHGLVSPLVDPEYGGFYFDEAAIRVLQRVAYLHTTCGINFTGTRMILDLLSEVEQLRAEVDSLRG